MIPIRLLHYAITLVKDAGKAIVKVYGEEDQGITLKSGNSPLTKALL